jgi:hypothetical protein
MASLKERLIDKALRATTNKPVWGIVDKVGKGTKANYDASKKMLTFCFNRGPESTTEQLKRLREQLMGELRALGYESRMKYNGEVLVENVAEEDVKVVTKNHKVVIHLNSRLADKKDKTDQPPDSEPA